MRMMRMIDVALSQVGVAEATGNNDGIPSERYSGGKQRPWCADFVIWCNAQSTEPRFVTSTWEVWNFPQVDLFEQGMKKRGWWRPYAPSEFAAVPPGPLGDVIEVSLNRPKEYPRTGDVVFFAGRGASDTKPAGRHVGIVEGISWRKDGAVLHTIEGNWKNQVSTVERRLVDAVGQNAITGFARAGGFHPT